MFFIMAAILLGELLGATSSNSNLVEEIATEYLTDSRTIVYQGRTIVMKSSPRSISVTGLLSKREIMHDGTAVDIATGIVATASHPDEPYLASQKAVAELLKKLRGKGLLDDQLEDKVVKPGLLRPRVDEREEPIGSVKVQPKQNTEAETEAVLGATSNLDRTDPSADEHEEAEESGPEGDLGRRGSSSAEPVQEPEELKPEEPNLDPSLEKRDPAAIFEEKGSLESQGQEWKLGDDTFTPTMDGRPNSKGKHEAAITFLDMVTPVNAVLCVALIAAGLLFVKQHVYDIQLLISGIFYGAAFLALSAVLQYVIRFLYNANDVMQRVTQFIVNHSKTCKHILSAIRQTYSSIDVIPDGDSLYTKHVMKTSHPTLDMLSTKHNYPMWSHCKGMAFILNNYDFEDSERLGSEIDLKNMRHLFAELGYVLFVEENLTGQEIMKSVRSFAAMFDQEGATYDSAVVVLMSHGNTGVILGVDLAKVMLRDVERELSADRCKALKGKPKMYFVQACRGPLTSVIPAVADGPDSAGPLAADRQQSPALYRGVLDVVPDHDFDGQTDLADVFYAYATTEGHLSLRSELIGSFFVQALCEVFFAEAHRKNLTALMDEVTDRVDSMKGLMYDTNTNRRVRVKQTPERRSRLRKTIYFQPHYSQSGR